MDHAELPGQRRKNVGAQSPYGPHDVKIVPRRVVAYVVDALLSQSLTLVTLFVTHSLSFRTVNIVDASGRVTRSFRYPLVSLDPIHLGLALGLPFLYFAILEWSFGYTIGKFLFGIRVVDFSGRTLSFSQCIIRNVVRYIDVLPFALIGLFKLISSDRRQRLGDRMADTLVVRSSSARQLAAERVSPPTPQNGQRGI